MPGRDQASDDVEYLADVEGTPGQTGEGTYSPNSIARHGCFPLRGVATYEDLYRLTYLRGPSGILVMLAQELTKS